jgi:CheY-like chemotaxis protein
MHQKKKVLVVDDDDLHLYTTKELLQDDRIEVLTHKNGFGVTNLIKAEKPDLVLLDINMPALAGDRLVDLIKGPCAANGTLIVFHSSNDEDSLRETVTTHGVRGYVCKGDVSGLRKKVNLYLDEVSRGSARDDNGARPGAAHARTGPESRSNKQL